MFSFVGQSPVSPSPTQGWSEPCLPASPVPPHAIQADRPLPCPSVPAEHPVSLPYRHAFPAYAFRAKYFDREWQYRGPISHHCGWRLSDREFGRLASSSGQR
ncbi:hypothetical protein ACCO45_012248 [Purpureocillium lilacinum]|uniref:Uncharacterized protein n=1 Tax=Purpureocillium lilacinum TaxID=33203 RepID=A0ACC4DD68_PURLI